jgi:hypothetical protein
MTAPNPLVAPLASLGATAPITAVGRWRRGRLWHVAVGSAVGLSIVLVVEVIRVLVGSNEHWLIEGRVYRSAQLGPGRLRSVVEQNGIRTILNLRGYSPDFDWYQDEARVARDSHVCLEDITLSAGRLPPPKELRRLVEVLDGTDYPILIHCRRGSDRTGLVAALILLLQSDAEVSTARAQCGPRYGHFRALSTARMDEFFDFYESWLAAVGRKHAPELFRHWLLHEYCPGPARAELEWLDRRESFRFGEPPVLHVRIHNRSIEEWRLVPGRDVGFHARCILFAPTGAILTVRRAGQFESTVAPGESIDLVFGLSRLPPGHYRALIDPVGPRALSFMQCGSEPLELEFDVRE